MEWEAIAHLFGGAAPIQPAQPPLQNVTPLPTPSPAPQPPTPTPAPPPVAAPSVPPAPVPAPAAPPAAPAPDGMEGIDPALVQLMQTNNVTPEEIQLVVGGKGYFPTDMPIQNYPPDFVKGCLIAAWPQVFQQIQKDRDELPF